MLILLNAYSHEALNDSCLKQIGSLINLLSLSIGKHFEKVCEACHISLNKTPIFGENGCISPGGVRIGKLLQKSSWFSK